MPGLDPWRRALRAARDAVFTLADRTVLLTVRRAPRPVDRHYRPAWAG
jgi:hypothetical protein